MNVSRGCSACRMEPKITQLNLVTCARIIALTEGRAAGPYLRKYTGACYGTHTDAVARIYGERFPDDRIGLAACHLHDTLEDTPCTAARIWDRYETFGWSHDATPENVDLVITLVYELTDVFTKECCPGLNRVSRKKLEAQRLSRISLRAKNIKLCDIIDNSTDILANDPKFAVIYLAEKKEILNGMQDADPVLLERAAEATAS